MGLRWTIAAAGALALSLLTMDVDLPWEFHLDGPEPQGEACPANAKPANLNFTLKDTANKPVRLSDYKGKVILLDFWATWCGPCKIEMPWFGEFQARYAGAGLQVIGVSVDDPLDKLQPYVLNMKINYPILQGRDHQDIQDAYGPLVGIPVTVLISRDAKICGKHVGLASKETFEREIKALL